MFDPELINQLVQRELNKTKVAEEYAIRPEEKPAPPNVEAISPKAAMLIGGLMDSASTFNFLKRGTAKEGNPAFKYFNKNPWAVIPTSAAVGTGYHFLHKLLGKISPKIADTTAGLLGGYQMGLGGRNFQNSFDSGKDEGSMSTVTRDLRLKGN